MANLAPAQLQQLLDTFQQLAQQLGHPATTQNALASAATLTSSLDARLGKFLYDPDAGQTFDQWHQRYGSLIEVDGKDLEDSTKVRLLIGKLGDSEYIRFRDSILPASPDNMPYKDVIAKLKSIFGETRSLFVRRFECFRIAEARSGPFILQCPGQRIL